MRAVTFLPIEGIGSIGPDCDLSTEIVVALQRCQTDLRQGDLLVVAHKIVSKAEGREVLLDSISPSPQALRLSETTGKDPRLVQLVLEESERVTAAGNGVLLGLHRLGWTCANAGVDQSNVGQAQSAVLLPVDPDTSARELSQALLTRTGIQVAVIISDTHGRPLRNGITGVAVGSHGIAPIKSYVGKRDLFDRTMQVSAEAVADELAAAASLLMGQGDEGIPVVLVRGYPYRFEACGSEKLKREEAQELFCPKGVSEYVE